MVDKKHIEDFLKINGLSSSAEDEEIRSLLVSARWHEEDVEAALVVLRENSQTHAQRIDSVHKVFNSDTKIQPETLSSLLGIDVQVESVITEHKNALERRYRYQIISISIISFLGSIIFLTFLMWYMKVGIFHEYALQF
jgi:hypothetical protein